MASHVNKKRVPDGWEKSTLAQVASVVMGQSPKGNTCNNDYSGLPLLNGPTEFGAYSPTPVQFTNDPRKLAEKADILFCVRGSTTGRMNWAEQSYAIGRGIAALRHKEGTEYQHFLKALIDYHLAALLVAATGSTFPNVSKDQLLGLQILLPPLPEQKAIAAVLSSLDDKIELLRRQNETLEKIAQAIFKEWFVEFNFPDKSGKPYKASGGKMVDSELGPIPEGWRMGTLSDIATVDWGNTSITKSSYVDSGEYLGVSAAGCDGRMSHKEHNYGAFVISAIGEYCGRVFLPGEEFTAIKNTLVVTQHDAPYSYFAYFGVQVWPMHRRGAAQPFLSKGDTEQMPLANPGKEMIESYTDSVSPLLGKVRQNAMQIGTLFKLRDTLLPKFMSGELRVGGT